MESAVARPRAAFEKRDLSLARNGYTLAAADAQVFEFTMAVASGELDHETVARWLWTHSAPLPEKD